MSVVSQGAIWLYYWQTLVGAGIALFGAWLTIRKIQEQISESKAQRLDEIARRHRAARVTLPLTLASVSEIIDKMTKNICDIRECYGPNESQQTLESILAEASIPNNFESISIPDGTLSSFERFVETLDNAADIRHVHELLASLQIAVSRYNSFDLRGAGAVSNLERLLIVIARVKILADVMFTYARMSESTDFSLLNNSRPAIWDQIHGAAQSLVFSRPFPDLYFPSFKDLIDRKKENDASPWVEGQSL